jgi:hypothetical protein
MKPLRVVLGIVVFFLLVVVPLWALRTPRHLAFVLLTLSDDHLGCAVRVDQAQPVDISCQEVGHFLDGLKLGPRASVWIAANPAVSPDSVAAIAKDLSSRSYHVRTYRVGATTKQLAPANDRWTGP